jgi:tetratricopeptide (TPR) repeat protein
VGTPVRPAVRTQFFQAIAVMTNSEKIRIFNAYYDISIAPLTFDFLTFLVLAELHRVEQGYNFFRVVFVPETADTKDQNLKDRFSDADRRWRLTNVLVPSCSMVPGCGGRITVCNARDEAAALLETSPDPAFPIGYTVENPVPCFQIAEVAAACACGKKVPSIRAPDRATDFVREWIQGHAKNRKIVCITLREADYGRERNSNIEAWAKFAKSLDAAEYFPIIVRDTYATFKPVPAELDGLCIFPQASVNLEIRLALYEQSYLNMQTNGGPLVLCHLDDKTRCVTLKPMVASWHDSTAFGIKRGVGVEIGAQPNFLSPFQRWVWDTDSFEAIIGAFRLMTSFIGSGTEGMSEQEKAFFAVNDEAPDILAKRLESVNSWGPAASILRHLIKTAPEDPDINFRLGRCETWLQNYPTAERHLELAAERDPANPAIEVAFGDLMTVQGNVEDAIVRYQKALQIDPSFTSSYVCLGLLMESLGNYDEAISFLEKAVSLQPDNGNSIRFLARNMEKRGRESEAKELFAKAEALAPTIQETSL